MITDQWLPEFDDPADLTPEERLGHIVRILALGVVRLIEEEMAQVHFTQEEYAGGRLLKLHLRESLVISSTCVPQFITYN